MMRPTGTALPGLTRSFKMVECLGRGGFGEVYRAHMRRSGGVDADVAVKVLRRDAGLDPQAVRRLRDEARLLARLEHPAILKVHDLLLLEGRLALITEYVDGVDLSTLLYDERPIPLRPLLEVLAQVAGALDAAWTAPAAANDQPLRLVHRDIKPSNIRLTRRGAVKLLDFGIARTDEVTREARTRTDMLIGSPQYMAPERFLDPAALPASDVFALAVSLVEGLIRRRIFELPVTMLAGLAVDAGRYGAFLDDQLRALPREVPDAVVGLIREGLEHDPSDRPSAAEFARRAERLADSVGGPSLTRWARDRDWPAPEGLTGELDGRELMEGTLEEVEESRALAQAPERRRIGWAARLGLLASGLSAAALASVGVAVVLLVAGWALWRASVAPDPPSPVELAPIAPSEPPAPEASPEPPAPVAPAPSVADEAAPPAPAPRRVAPKDPPRAAPSPTPASDPSVAPPAAQPVPAPAEPAEVEAPAVAFVGVSGPVAARLVGPAGVFELPTQVPPGRYVAEGKFTSDYVPTQLTFEARAGARYAVTCSRGMWNCSVSEPGAL